MTKVEKKRVNRKQLPATRETLHRIKAPALIKNRIVRAHQVFRRKEVADKVKRKERSIRKKRVAQGQEQQQTPITIEDKRIFDENFVLQSDEELELEEQQDEFAPFLTGTTTPSILLTTTMRPSNKLYDFVREFRELIPNTHYYPRGKYSLPHILEDCKGREFTHLIVARETKTVLRQLLVVVLPDGPTFKFATTSLVLNKDIDHHGAWTDHVPELILKNFNSRVGRRTGRLLASMFPMQPEFRGRRVVTFHNQRDFIFLRHHRYIFDEAGQSVALQEIGPKLTLRLKEIKSPTDREWLAEDALYVKRQAVYL